MKTVNLTLHFGNSQREFHYRKGTADEAAILQALKVSAYDTGLLRRGAELASLYERLCADEKAPLIVDTSAKIGAAAAFFAYKFPKARVFALESDPSDFQLLTANTTGLPVDCIQGGVAELGAGHGGPACTTINKLYEAASDAAPFIVKLDVEAASVFAASADWIERTPVIIATLADCLIPGTAHSRAFVDVAATWNRDFVYLEDNVFSISRDIDLLKAA